MPSLKMNKIIGSKWRCVRQGADLKGLVDSIDKIGQCQPIVISKAKKNGFYNIISGTRRFDAQARRGKSKLEWGTEVIEITKNSINEEIAFIDLNLQIKSLSVKFVDELILKRRNLLMEKHNKSIKGDKGALQDTPHKIAKKIAKSSGKSHRGIQRSLKRSQVASDKVKKARDDQKLTSKKTDILMALDSQDDQDKFLKLATNKKYKPVVLKTIVAMAKEKGTEEALDYLESSKDDLNKVFQLSGLARKLNKSLTQSLQERAFFSDASLLVELDNLRTTIGRFLRARKAEQGTQELSM